MAKRRKTSKAKVGVAVTGRTVAYIQKIKKGKKYGKPEPVVITTVKFGKSG